MVPKSLVSLLLGGALAITACSGTSDASPPDNGVDDVLKACELRVPWQNGTASACSTCIGLATTPRCSCTDRDYAGKCSDQQTAKGQEPSCEGTEACVAKCPRTDCACIDGCYASAAACRTRASAVDGCVVSVCHSYCE